MLTLRTSSQEVTINWSEEGEDIKKDDPNPCMTHSGFQCVRCESISDAKCPRRNRRMRRD